MFPTQSTRCPQLPLGTGWWLLHVADSLIVRPDDDGSCRSSLANAKIGLYGGSTQPSGVADLVVVSGLDMTWATSGQVA
jgi:hypothetical protein